ncbi:MAG: calcium-binding protein, partial [Sphingobium sp.]
TNIEILTGSAQADTLYGASGNETLNGGAGDDILVGGAGNDILDGGAGNDSASYATSSAAITASFASGALVVSGADGSGDTFISIEGVIGTALDDTLTGGSGAETLDGGAGNDTLYGSLGADTLRGGAGTDILSYAASNAGVTVYLDGTVGVGGHAAGDIVSGIETVQGSAYADAIYGAAADETLNGGAGNDSLYGGAGSDTLNGQDGDDLLVGGLGADVIDGGNGNDTVSYAASASGVTAYLTGAAGSGGDAQGDSIANAENLVGSAFADILTGDGGANLLDGGNGDDVLIGGAGSDTLTGGAGTDMASYATSGSGVTVSLLNTALNTGDAAGDSFSGIEGLIGSSFNDSLYGDGSANRLDGGIGDDTLVGGGGADALVGGAGTDTADYSGSSVGVTVYMDGRVGVGGDAAGDTLSSIEVVVGSGLDDRLVGDTGANTLSGGAGNDILEGGAGADSLIGGSGSDTATYANAGSAVTANLSNSLTNSGEAAGDSYNSIEHLTGSAYNDTLTGDAGANILDGGAGNDILVGGAGADTLVGGLGTDTADYSGAGAGIGLTLGATGSGTAGDASGDTLSGIEKILGSGYNDNFTLSLGNGWSVDGGAGNDAVHLAANSGSVTAANLMGVLSHVEEIDFTNSNVMANLTIDAAFIQSMVGAGTSSALTIKLDGNDSISLATVPNYSYDNAGHYILYDNSNPTQEVARLTVA